MWASLQALAYVSNENELGSANGLPRKISVLLLNDASSTQSSGPAVIRAQATRATCDRPVAILRSRFGSGARPADGALVPGVLVMVVIVSPLAAQASTDSRRVADRVTQAKVRVR